MTTRRVKVCDLCQTSAIDEELPGDRIGQLTLQVSDQLKKPKDADDYLLPDIRKNRYTQWDFCGSCSRQIKRKLKAIFKEGADHEENMEEY